MRINLQMKRCLACGVAAAAMTLVSNVSVRAEVPVGSSVLFDTVDYSDTFTVGTAARPDGLYNNNAGGGYNVENSYANAPRTWGPTSNFSFNSGAGSTCCGYPSNTGNAGAATGLAQSGGGEYGFLYGLRSNYVVQVDAIMPADRLDVSSGAAANIFAPDGVSLFFRRDGGAAPGIGIFNPGAGEADTGFTTGVTDLDWHNFAVRFNQDAKALDLYVDQALRGSLDLNTFAGGGYANFSNKVVSTGGTFVNWQDNWQVGGMGAPPPPPPPIPPHPNPGPIANPPSGLISFWDFDEAAGPDPNFVLDYAYDRVGANHGSFEGAASRYPGLIGTGAGVFNNANGSGVNVGAGGAGNTFSASDGISVEALIVSLWDPNDGANGQQGNGDPRSYDEIFRKEDGGNRILLSFQRDEHGGGANPAVAPGPVLSFGLNVGGAYGELDMPLDGLDGRPALADLQDGLPHHVVATYDALSGDKSIYIDGALRMNVNLGAGSLIASGGGTAATIGSILGGEPFTGIIDEVGVWSRALSAAEIGLHFANIQAGNNYFVPEPASFVMLGTALAGLAVLAWRRRQA